jgi:murein DD-endopeptidase MepM/ murein hydrolase activator NlpD
MLGIRMTRRGRVIAATLVIAVAAAFAGVWGLRVGGSTGLRGHTARADERAPAGGRAGVAGSPEAPDSPLQFTPGTDPLAQAGDLMLYLPARRFIALAYHEASGREALEMQPLGTCTRNENRTKFRRPHPVDGPRYVVMSSRGRPHPATSALDVAVRLTEPVLSPVTGTVIRVKRYRLYGTYLDMRVVVQPADHSDLRVVLIHLTDIQVRRGSLVVAGTSVLGYARALPFRSQVNDYVGAGVSHVHLEVKRVGA